MKIPVDRARLLLISLAMTILGGALFFVQAPQAAEVLEKTAPLTIEGGAISGLIRDGVSSYKGIPYAASPVGLLRWKPPQPVIAWSGVRDGSDYSPDCPQAPYPVLSIYYSPPRPQSEDCLCLNVWTAAHEGEKRPVMVWIHGGAFTRGSGAVPVYDGSALARKGVVLVTINYRLGPLGFLAHPELTAESPQKASGNYGFMDQLAALRWVKKNISRFGGDEGNVTIFGESAGSWSVNTLVATPLGKGLFHRAIGQSGGSFGPLPSLGEAEKAGLALGKNVGAEGLATLRSLPADKLIEASSRLTGLRSLTTVDGWVLPGEIGSIFAAGKQNDIPVIVGSNANEMTSLLLPGMIPKSVDGYRKILDTFSKGRSAEFDRAYPLGDGEMAVSDNYLGILRDRTFTLQMRTWARMTGTGRSKAWWYFFNHTPPVKNSNYLRAFHAAEISYVFNNLTRGAEPPRDIDVRLAETISDYWVNFAKSGDPNGRYVPVWKPYTREDEHYIELGSPVQLRKGLLRDQLDLLERLK